MPQKGTPPECRKKSPHKNSIHITENEVQFIHLRATVIDYNFIQEEIKR
jgi:hypothetical protein